jgi:hydrogenase nickel incorporation protein HypA/HybF
MHEFSLGGGILRIVEDATRRERFTRVSRLTLEAGALAGMQAPRFPLEATAPDTFLEGAEFVIEEPPGQAWCMACAAIVPMARRGDACPRCGGCPLQPCGAGVAPAATPMDGTANA